MPFTQVIVHVPVYDLVEGFASILSRLLMDGWTRDGQWVIGIIYACIVHKASAQVS